MFVACLYQSNKMKYHSTLILDHKTDANISTWNKNRIVIMSDFFRLFLESVKLFLGENDSLFIFKTMLGTFAIILIAYNFFYRRRRQASIPSPQAGQYLSSLKFWSIKPINLSFLFKARQSADSNHQALHPVLTRVCRLKRRQKGWWILNIKRRSMTT